VRQNSISVLGMALVGSLCMSGIAWGSPITQYSDRATWTAATTNQVTIDFNVLPDGGWQAINSATGYTANGVSFVPFQNASTVLGYLSNALPGDVYDFGTETILRTVDKGSWYPYTTVPWITITLPGSTYAFGVDLMTYLPAGNPPYGRAVNVWVSDGTTTYDYLNLPTNPRIGPPAFFGVISTTPIAWVKVQAVDAETLIDNFTVGAAAAVSGGEEPPAVEGGETPEMATLILLLSGLFFIQIGRKKSRVEDKPAAA